MNSCSICPLVAKKHVPSSTIHTFKSLLHQFMHSVCEDIELYARKKAQLIFPKLTKNIIMDLCHESEMIFRSEPSLIDTPSPCVIIGDLHGHVLDLFRILKYFGIPHENYLNPKFKDDPNFEIKFVEGCDQKFIFLGDIIDRGEFSVETITIVFLLKVLFPTNVFLIRGNHEFNFLAKQCGFLEQVHLMFDEFDHSLIDSKHSSGSEVYNAFMSAFSFLPFGIRIDNKMLCVHGGIGPQVFSIKNVLEIQRPINEFGESEVVDSLVWSDPADQGDSGNDSTEGKNRSFQQPISDSNSDPTIIPLNSSSCQDTENKADNHDEKLFEPSNRGTGYIYSSQALDDFLNFSNLDVLVRAHECVIGGCEEIFNGHLLTVFSASNYCGFVRNYSAVLLVNPGGEGNILDRCRVFKFSPLDYLRKLNPIAIDLNVEQLSYSMGKGSSRGVEASGSFRRYSSYVPKNASISQLPQTPLSGHRSNAKSKISSAKSDFGENKISIVSPRDAHKMAGLKSFESSSFTRPQHERSKLPTLQMKRNQTHNSELPSLASAKTKPNALIGQSQPAKIIRNQAGIALMPSKPRSRSEFK